MSSPVLFTPQIFDTYEALRDFFSGKDEIKAIKANTAAREAISLAKKVAIFVMVPFNFIAGYFFSISACFLGLVHANNLAIRCSVLSSYFLFNSSCFNNISLLGKDLLVLAKNMHDPSTTDVYLSKQMERKSISKDERLIQLIYTTKIEKLNEKISMAFRKISPFCDKDKNEKKGDELNKFILNIIDKKFGELNFLSLIGNCYGMSVWFAYLYLNSNQANQDPLKHISVVAKLFENGAPRQASILQSLFSNCDLNKCGINFLNLQSADSINNDLLGKESPDCFKFLNEIENGVYLMDLEGEISHAMCVVKEGNHKYIFDPNVGLVKIDDEKTFKAFYDSQMKGKFNMLRMSKIDKEASSIQAPKKVSEAPKNILFRISHLFSRKAA